MRWAAWLAIAVSVGSAAAAHAQTSAVSLPDTDARRLSDAAFANRGKSLTDWQIGELRLAASDDGAAVDSLRVKMGERLSPIAGLPGAQDFDVTVIRSWPKAVSFSGNAVSVDIAPHAGVGVSSSRGGGPFSRGFKAEGGATITVSPKSRSERALQQLRDMGVKDGASFGDAGRWYLFAAASGQAVGLNMMHDDEKGWDRAGWSTDVTSGLVGDAQVGVGWRKGDSQASFGVVHREVRGRHMIFGQNTRDDTMAAFSFSIRPGQ